MSELVANTRTCIGTKESAYKQKDYTGLIFLFTRKSRIICRSLKNPINLRHFLLGGMNSVANQIENRITSSDKGSFLFASDFVGFSTPSNAAKTLQRLADYGTILRICNGVYYYPRIDTEYGLGVIRPTTTEIALAIARRDRVSIFPSGPYALNALGLSSQVPVNAVFITNGAARKVNIGGGRYITFKHSDNAKNFQYKSKEMQLVVAALKEIGEGNLTDNVLARIKEIVSIVPSDIYEHDLALAPAWVINTLQRL